jgi:integrase
MDVRSGKDPALDSKLGARVSDNLYQRNGIWWLKIQVAGTVHRRSLRTSSRPVAKRHAAEIVAQLKEHAVTGNQRHTYDEAAKRWYRETLPSLEPATGKRYLVSSRSLSKHFKGLFLDQIKTRHIADFVSARKEENTTDATIRRDLTALSSIFRSAATWGWIDQNVAKLWDRSTLGESSSEIHRLDQASFDAVVKECPPAMAALLRFLLETGMRLEEACSLTWRNVDRQGETAFISKTKTHQPRTIELTPAAMKVIAKLPVSLGSPYVFTHGDGGRYVSPSGLFGKIRKRTQESAQDFRPFRIHDLRHEFAARWLEAGGSIYDLSRYLGHQSVTTTERHYLRFVPTGKISVARRLQGTNGGTGESGRKSRKSQKTA